MSPDNPTPAAPIPYANQVRICGRVSAAPVERTLPSGDVLVSFRVIVNRAPRARGRSKVRVDTFDCTAWTATLRKSARRLGAGDVVEVNGRLTRRFERAGGAATSRVDIEVTRCRRVTRGPLVAS